MIATSGSDCSGVAAVLPKLPVVVDTKGRLRVCPEQRRVILAEFERSGLSAPRFARHAGLKYSTLAAWVQRYRRSKRSQRKAPLRLLEAVVSSAAAAPALIVHLRGGARLELQDADQVPLAAALVRALEQSC